MEKHWRSVVFLLVPVMTFGWLVTSLFIWGMFYQHMDWLDSLCVAACVTATDPVLASSVVGKGKFAKRVPKHLRDILSAESGCNDGMAFPFLYLAVYILKYKSHPDEVALEWFCVSILYECVFGAIYGVTIGYIARRAVKIAHERDWIDRESFLVFYFVLALFCAGSGSLLGMDDLLIGFACGVGFSNDGWFSERTEEEQVSNVIDLLLNLAFFVYFGTIIPWDHYNSGHLGLDVWRLVVIALLVVFFRRIPAMLLLKPLIPDIKTWREALFAGHFGPIGVGAIFVAILARAELEEGPETTPLKNLPEAPYPHLNIIYLIWPIVTFLVMTSILVHGSSIAVFTLGKHINTLALTMSYSRGVDEPNWMNRLPRIQSRSKSSMSRDSFDNEKQMDGDKMLPLAAAGKLLRRRKEEDGPKGEQSQASSRQRSRKARNSDPAIGPGGPISQSAIEPATRPASPSPEKQSRSDSDTLAMKSETPPEWRDESRSESEDRDARAEDEGKGAELGPEESASIYEEGDDTIYEDKDGNVLAVEENTDGDNELARQTTERDEARRLAHESGADRNKGVATNKDVPETVEEKRRESEKRAKKSGRGKESRKSETPETPQTNLPGKVWRDALTHVGAMGKLGGKPDTEKKAEGKSRKASSAGDRESAPARAYQYGNTIIIENEDGEVIKKYDIPNPDAQSKDSQSQQTAMKRIRNMGKMLGMNNSELAQAGAADAQSSGKAPGSSDAPQQSSEGGDDDDRLVRFTTGGRRMSKLEFIEQLQKLDPRRRVMAVEDSDVSENVKREARKEAREQAGLSRTMSRPDVPPTHREESEDEEFLARVNTNNSDELRPVQSKEVPFHDISRDLRSYQLRSGEGETAAERRRRLALQRPVQEEDSDDDGTDRVPPTGRSDAPAHQTSTSTETPAERRRRMGALGLQQEEESDSDEDDEPRQRGQQSTHAAAPSAPAHPRPARLRWASSVGR